MAIYYSPTEKGFYVDGIHETIPSDKVVVSANAWQHLIANQNPTSQISADPQGNPILIDPTQGNKELYTSVGVQ